MTALVRLHLTRTAERALVALQSLLGAPAHSALRQSVVGLTNKKTAFLVRRVQ